MKSASWMFGVFASLTATACSTETQHYSASSDAGPSAAAIDDHEEKIALDAVPASVKRAALAAVPGLVLVGAEKEIEHGVTVYSVEGRAGADRYEVEVSVDGKVIEVEKNGDDDDHDDGDDDDDRDDDNDD